jgi:small subunit ribosomal protein S16
MPTKIRLQRKGKKGQAFYHLVVADGRAPRDGRFIEKLGTYNPMTHPATIEINFDRALYWVQVGAQPTDTARSILSNQGVLLKQHLLKGVAKGALTEEQVEDKFSAWLKEKAEKLANMAKDSELSQKELNKKRLEEERKINEAKAQELAKKRAKEGLKEAAARGDDVQEDAADEPAAEESAPAESVSAPEEPAEEPAPAETPGAAEETSPAPEDKTGGEESAEPKTAEGEDKKAE